jgi:hypothetical protein
MGARGSCSATRWRWGWLAAAALIGASPAGHAVGTEAITHCGSDAACLSRLELAALRNSGGTARREGAELILQAGMQAPTRFIDLPPLTHQYLGRLEGLQLQVVRAASAGQRPAWWLLADGGQPPLRFDALPIAGPAGRHFVIADGNSLSLYQRSGARWSLQFRLDAAPGLRWAVKGWRADEAAVRLEWIWPEAPAACAGQAAQGQLQLRDGPYGWDLVPEAPHRC